MDVGEGLLHYWQETQAGSVVEVPCNEFEPEVLYPVATRECSENATWLEPDTSECVDGTDIRTHVISSGRIVVIVYCLLLEVRS